jgi:hypothetical protein
MDRERRDDDNVGLPGILAVLLGLVLVAIILFTPVRTWLNQIPYLWEILYPVLTVVAGYLMVTAVLGREGWLAIVKWAVLALGALAATVHIFGGPRVLFTVGRWAAVAFIALEIIAAAIKAVRGSGEAQAP